MATGFHFRKSESGATAPLRYITMHEAGKDGDVIVPYASAANQADLMDDTAEAPLGVLVGDTDAAAEGAYIPCRPEYIFEVQCSSDEKYVDADDRDTTCDIDTYTSGAMGIDPATDANHHVFILGLVDGESDDTDGNKVLVKFNPAVTTYKY